MLAALQADDVCGGWGATYAYCSFTVNSAHAFRQCFVTFIGVSLPVSPHVCLYVCEPWRRVVCTATYVPSVVVYSLCLTPPPQLSPHDLLLCWFVELCAAAPMLFRVGKRLCSVLIGHPLIQLPSTVCGRKGQVMPAGFGALTAAPLAAHALSASTGAHSIVSCLGCFVA